jgi:gluconolactonase
MQGKERNQRRSFLKAAAGSGLAVLTGSTRAQSFPFAPNQRYPDPAILILDPSFAKYRPYSSTVEQVGTGMRGADGPVYFPNPVAGKPGYLLCSDIPNNRLMKFDEASNKFTIHKEDVNFVNGNTRDRQGRLISCEHSVTRRITRTEKNGKITVLADRFDDKRLNAPHDIVVKSDDSIWFTDPIFGISGEWEGYRAKSEQATTNVYRLTKDAKITAVITGLVNPTGIAFSPDEKNSMLSSRGAPPPAAFGVLTSMRTQA